MKKITLVLLAMVFLALANYAEAGIKAVTLNEDSGEVLISYEFVKGDNPWKIYKELFPGKISLKSVQERIMAPSGIVNPKKIKIGKTISVLGKNKDLNYLLPKEEELLVESEKPAGNAMSSDEVYAELKRFDQELERKMLKQKASSLENDKPEIIQKSTSLTVALATEKELIEALLKRLRKRWFFIPAILTFIFSLPFISIAICYFAGRWESRRQLLETKGWWCI